MRPGSRARALAGVVVGIGLLVAVEAGAQTAGAPAESAIPAGDLPDVLRARAGKPVMLLLRSGTEYGGTVGEVRSDAVVLRSLAGKEFYDALVRLDAIEAVEVRRDR